MNHYNDALQWIARLDETSRHYDVAMPGGGTMRWRRFGDGNPLVLIHGGHGSWLHWARNIAALARRHTVWVPDLPGYGDSGGVGGAGGLDDLYAMVELALDQLVGTHVPVDIASFSFGTLAALQLAMRRPVHRLALLGPAGHGGVRRPFPAMINWHGIEAVAARREALTRNMKTFMLHDAAAADQVAVAVYELSCVRTRFRSKEASLAASLRTTLGKLERIPVLAIWGGRDVTIAEPGKVVREGLAGLANTHWYEVPGAGHWVQFEQADAINHALGGWFSHGELPGELVDLARGA